MSDRLIRAVALVYACLLAVAILWVNRHFYHDDAYITLRYAQNSLHGVGFVWNAGEYVQGYTNFLLLVLVRGLASLGLDLVVASRVVGIAAYLGLLGVMIAFARQTKKEASGVPVWHLPIIVVLTASPLLVWSIGGLETVLFSLLVAAAYFVLLARDLSLQQPVQGLVVGVLLGLGYLTRPDAAVFITVVLVWMLTTTLISRQPSWTTLASYIVGVTAIVLPYSIWQFSYYGDIVPNTFYAKAGIPLIIRLSRSVPYVFRHIFGSGILYVLPIALFGVAIWQRNWNAKHSCLMFSILGYAAYVVWAGGDHMRAFRLLAPVIPLAGMLLSSLLSRVIPAERKYLVNVVTLLLLVVPTFQLVYHSINFDELDLAAIRGRSVGLYIQEAWPAGSLVALHTAGSTPYYAPSHRYIDMLGLNDPTIAMRQIRKPTISWQLIPGHYKGDGKYVLSRRPDYIILGGAEGTVCDRPWFLSDLELCQDPRFVEGYEVRSVWVDKEGRKTTGEGMRFTYYERID